MNAMHLFQVVCAPASLADADPALPVLDGRVDDRPDWGGYSAVRQFLLHERLDEQAFYGFVSPRFRAETGHSPADLQRLVARHGPDADVLLCSAHPGRLAFCANVFEDAELLHPGLLQAARPWLLGVGVDVAPAQLVMDARQMVFGNQFLARPAFWREWLRLGEALYACCEGPPSALQRQLTAISGGMPVKAILIERIASLLLAVQPHWHSEAADPYAAARWPNEALRRDPTDAIVCDALKHALRQTEWTEYATAFGQLRRQALSGDCR